MLSPHARDEEAYYGYGIWLKKQTDGSFAPYFCGFDPGVSFVSSRINDGTVITAVSNMGHDVWKIVADQ